MTSTLECTVQFAAGAFGIAPNNNPAPTRILAKGALQTGLDALTIIPGEGDIAAAFYGGKEAFQSVQFAAGLGSTGISIGSSDRTGIGIGATRIGVELLEKNATLVKGAAEAIPLVGQFVGGAATLWDIGSTLHEYDECEGW